MSDSLEGRWQAYVLAVTGKETVWHDQKHQLVSTILATLPTSG